MQRQTTYVYILSNRFIILSNYFLSTTCIVIYVTMSNIPLKLHYPQEGANNDFYSLTFSSMMFLYSMQNGQHQFLYEISSHTTRCSESSEKMGRVFLEQVRDNFSINNSQSTFKMHQKWCDVLRLTKSILNYYSIYVPIFSQ